MSAVLTFRLCSITRLFWHGESCLAWSSLLSRYCRCVDCVCCNVDMRFWFLSYLKLESGDQLNLKCGVFRATVSGATLQSVSRCLLVVTKALLLFHDGTKKLQCWKHKSSEANFSWPRRRRKREACVVLSVSPRLTQKETRFDMSETL